MGKSQPYDVELLEVGQQVLEECSRGSPAKGVTKGSNIGRESALLSESASNMVEHSFRTDVFAAAGRNRPNADDVYQSRAIEWE